MIIYSRFKFWDFWEFMDNNGLERLDDWDVTFDEKLHSYNIQFLSEKSLKMKTILMLKFG